MKNFNLFFKKSFISFLCLAILLASFPASVFAVDETIRVDNGNNVTADKLPTGSSSDKIENPNGGMVDLTPSGNTGSTGGIDIKSTPSTGTLPDATRDSSGNITTNSDTSDLDSLISESYPNAEFTIEDFAPGDSSVSSGSSGSSASSVSGAKSLDEIIPTQSTSKNKSSSALTDGVSCAVSSALAKGITGLVTKGISTIFGSATEPEVPVDPTNHKSKEIGSLVVWGVPILPSWDAIAFCLANIIITYVADSTISWIQSGFKGKPAFVDDPTKLFKDLADYQMNDFISTLQSGLLCENSKSQVTSALIRNYTSKYSTEGKCALGALEEGVTDMINRTAGSFTYEGWFAVSQNPNNNAVGQYLKGQSEYQRQIATRQGTIKSELDQNNGYFSWRSKDGTDKGKIITPGTAIQTQLEQRLNLAPGRLVLAQKFDQVVSTLVNYLIKTALTETLGAVRKASN